MLAGKLIGRGAGTGAPRRTRRAGRVAALACAGALTLTGCDFTVYDLPLPGGADLGDDPYAVTVQFRDVLDLVPQSAVKVDDVTVGRVDDIRVDGFTAEVTVLVRGDVRLPDNAVAEIRQTSLLGEKFVSLAPPETGASSDPLSDDDVIPLDRSGRNTEVEEVLGAMSLLFNGGGVAQLKTIAAELNKVLEGREADVKSVLGELDTFMGQLDRNKEEIVQAIESLNRLAIAINEQRGTIELALDEMPAALASIDRQRDDLVLMLGALTDLSSVATDVIRRSKDATIDNLEKLDPILTKLAEAGDALPKSLQVFLTYPFVDAVVGTNPVQARNLHMGDFTNLSIQLDLDLRRGLPDYLPAPPGAPEIPLPDLLEECKKSPAKPVCDGLDDTLQKLPKLPLPTLTNPDLKQLPGLELPGSTGGGASSGTGKKGNDGNDGKDGQDGGDGGTGGSGGTLCGVLKLCRVAPGAALGAGPTTGPTSGPTTGPTTGPTSGPTTGPSGPTGGDGLGYDPTLGALLIQGMVQR